MAADIQYKKERGQYFTIADELQQFVFDKVKYKSECLLEPSFGAGHLLKKFKEFDDSYPIVCYEIDKTIKPIVKFNQFQSATYGDFTKQKITKKFKTIIGNPPYVRLTSNNLYIQFIEICYGLLDENGELIFIVPSDFIKLTGASSIINVMVQNGSFTDFLFPHNEKLFANANIDVLIFRYEKHLKTNNVLVNGKPMICNVQDGVITFSDTQLVGDLIKTLFNVYVGLVSGYDAIYRAEFGNIEILNDKAKTEKFIFPEKFPTDNAQIDKYLLKHKDDLLQRKIRKFTETNWYEWGAPRNIAHVRKYWGQPCIYVRNMTRNKVVAFIGTVQYFSGGLLCLIPKKKMTKANMQKIIKYLNSAAFQSNYLYAGRFKIGHKQLSNAIIPNFYAATHC